MQRAFNFVDLKELPSKPRKDSLTEVRGAYYEAFTVSQLESLLSTWGFYIDGFKFAGGTQALMYRDTVRAFNTLAHQYGVYVNTGGFIERILIQDPNNLSHYLQETKELAFDVIEVSSGMFEHADDFKIEDQVKIVKQINNMGLKAKPEITIMSGVGGGVKEFGYEKATHNMKSLDQMLSEAKQFLAAGAYMLMVESEGITEGIEDPNHWRKDIIKALIKEFGVEKLMFEVSPEDDEARRTFKWYLKEISPNVSLMMNSKNIVEYNAWRLRLWGDRTLWKDKKIVFENV